MALVRRRPLPGYLFSKRANQVQINAPSHLLPTCLRADRQLYLPGGLLDKSEVNPLLNGACLPAGCTA